jgi:hypothetical protein
MKRWLSAILTGFVCVGGVGRAAESAVTISIDATHPGARVAPDFSGLSFETSLLRPNENGVRYFRPDNQPLITLFHTLGIKSLRIGGNTGDRDWKRSPSRADIDSLFAFAKLAQVKVIYCLRLHNGDPQEDAATAKYIMDRYAPLVTGFSIGQEPSAYPVTVVDDRPATERMGAAREKYPYSVYAADWKKFAEAIIAAVPEVKFCGPGVHNNGTWARKFMTDFGHDYQVAMITEHLYPGGAGGKVPTPEIGRDRMLGADFIHAYQKLYDGFGPMAVTNALPYRLEEVNNYFNGGATNVSNTFASALWGLDYMWWWAEHGAAGVNFHTGDRVAAGSMLRPSKYTAFFSTTNGFDVRPLGYGLAAFAQGSQGRLVAANLDNPDHLNLGVYSVLGDDGNVYLTIVNKEHGSMAHDTAISPGKMIGAQMISLTAPGNDVAATTGETLGGTNIQNDGQWQAQWTAVSTPVIHVPAGSAVVIKWAVK